MIALDEEALICDLAETYHIFDYKSLPIQFIAVLSSGLGINSRIKQKIRGEKASLEMMLSMSIIDHLKILIWQNSEDGRKGRNFPKSLLQQLLEPEKKERVAAFENGDEFEKMRQKIIEEVEENG